MRQPDACRAQLWRTVDELVAGPVEKIELNARVEMLLRARRLGLENGALLRRVDDWPVRGSQ